MASFGYDVSLSDSEVAALCEAMKLFGKQCEMQYKETSDEDCHEKIKTLLSIEKKMQANKRFSPIGISLPGF